VKKISRVQLRMTYRCCGMEWSDEYALVFSMHCPDCGVLIEPRDIVELESMSKSPKRVKARGR
jgi:hypothetical protein